MEKHKFPSSVCVQYTQHYLDGCSADYCDKLLLWLYCTFILYSCVWYIGSILGRIREGYLILSQQSGHYCRKIFKQFKLV
jgi:hypothetical protein